MLAILLSSTFAAGQTEENWIVPSLPNGQTRIVCDEPYLVAQPFFIKKLPGKGVKIAKTPPQVTFAYLPVQDHRGPRGALWSYWGQGCIIGDKYYTAFGDHNLVTRLVEWTPETGTFRTLVDISSFLNQPEGHYTPGKVHTQLTLCKDGWIYYATHNAGGRPLRETIFNGDWILRTHPDTGQTEIVEYAPVGKASIPVGFADPQRMIFFGGTEQFALFFAYDLVNRRILFQSEPGQGPQRCMPYARSTGRIYIRGNWHKDHPQWLDSADGSIHIESKPDDRSLGVMRRWDIATGEATVINTDLNPRAASVETEAGIVWIAAWDGTLWKLTVKNERFEPVGNLAVIGETYITSLAVDPTGRYLYYCPGAHGSAQCDGTPLLQYDTKTNKAKVICFLSPATLLMNTGFIANGTYGLSITPDGSTIMVTWNGFRPALPELTVGKSWDVCAVTAIHIPPDERAVD